MSALHTIPGLRIALFMMWAGMGCGEETEVAEAPLTIEDRVKEKSEALKKVNCEIKALEREVEVDTEQKAQLENDKKKLIKKSIDLLNKNGLEGKEIRRLNQKYMQPAMDTLDC